MQEEMNERLRKLEYQMWGVDGSNGVVSQLKGLRTDLNRWRELEERKEQAARDERKSDVRWRIGTAVAIISAILIAAGIVANAL